MDFKYLNKGVFGTSAVPENPDFLEQVTQIVFHSLASYEEAFSGFYFPLKRNNFQKGKQLITRMHKPKDKGVTGYTKTFLSQKYDDWTDHEKKTRSEKVGKLEIYLLDKKESISPKDTEDELFAGAGIPVAKSNYIEVVMPFGMLKNGKFYSNIVSLNQTFDEGTDSRCFDIGVCHTVANEFLKDGDVYVNLGNKRRNFYPKPSLVLTRGFTPSGKNWGKKSTISNSWVNAMQLFGLISINPDAKNAERFLNYINERAIVPWQDYESKRKSELIYHSESSIV